MDYYISVALIAVSSLLSCIAGLPIYKILQLSGYKVRGVFSWWKATGYDTLIRYVALMLFGFIAMIVYVGCFGVYEYARYCAAAIYIVLNAVFIFSVLKQGGNGVKFTGRMMRMIAADTVITLVLGAGVAWAVYANVYCQTLTAALGIFVPFVAMAACCIMSPFEKLNNRKYIKRAEKKLEEAKPTVIGITGSYGKTTAKNLLCGMLKSGGNDVLATPGSYNTPMGICLTVNNSLADQKYFIAEMGARFKGDIEELCGIAKPKYGIITAVGDMHIETLKSRKGVADAKYELAEALPCDGLLVLNGYNESCKELSERKAPCDVDVAGEEGSRVMYKDLKIDAHGTSFMLVLDGAEYPVTTRILGAHIAQLACVCAVVALHCGVSPQNIAAAIESAEPVEHRLQLLNEGSAVTVIDDSYNSNPVGASNALDVLSCFDGKKIIITPGFVELGAIEKQSNIELGAKIAKVCDYAFLIGSRAADISKGAIDGGMIDGAVRSFTSRDDGVKALEEITGDKVVLFENDLPDNIK